jgi:hypothetical protein
MQELSAEDRLLLERLLKAHELRERVPAEMQIPVGRAEKYAFPIGFTDAGIPFPIPGGEDSQ